MRSADDKLPQRLTAGHIRVATFPVTRGGYDPDAVHAYLELVADEVTRLRESLAAAHADADRVKRTLRRWQSDHASTYRGAPPCAVIRRDWPINRS